MYKNSTEKCTVSFSALTMVWHQKKTSGLQFPKFSRKRVLQEIWIYLHFNRRYADYYDYYGLTLSFNFFFWITVDITLTVQNLKNDNNKKLQITYPKISPMRHWRSTPRVAFRHSWSWPWKGHAAYRCASLINLYLHVHTQFQWNRKKFVDGRTYWRTFSFL